MQYADKTLSCRDCNATFVFTSGEQEFYASRGLTSPSRGPAFGGRKAERSNTFGPARCDGGGYMRPAARLFLDLAVAMAIARSRSSPRGLAGDCSDCFERSGWRAARAHQYR